MSKRILNKNRVRRNRKLRVRKKLQGTLEKPRLSMHKSLRHLGAQLIDDDTNRTLIGLSTLSKEAKGQKKSIEGARFLGKRLAELALEKNIQNVVFDRGRFKFHGLLKAFAEEARKNGLKF